MLLVELKIEALELLRGETIILVNAPLKWVATRDDLAIRISLRGTQPIASR